MNYKEKYEKALERARDMLSYKEVRREDMEYLFPELKESEDERIRKMLIKFFGKGAEYNSSTNGIFDKDILAWLEKQGKETSWKPSKEEMDVLYGLAYITNQYDEHKEEVITRLYQDLKREFFNGSSYENMFPTNTSTEDDVRRRSTIQVLEYARSLDAYNQFGKADIDKNIAWLEKQGTSYTKRDVDDAYVEGMAFAKNELEKQKSSWGEEDEKMKDLIISVLEVNHSKGIFKAGLRAIRTEEIVSWLKSLRHQSRWKPSNEQIKVLNEVLNFAANHESPYWNDYIFETLNNLIRQLKKLKGE